MGLSAGMVSRLIGFRTVPFRTESSTMNRIRFLQGIAAALCIAAASTSGLAQPQGYPNKPIRLVVPFPAGGATDLFARTLSQKMGEKLGNAVVIDNKPGAGGGIGSDLAAKAPADGYT